MRSLVGGGDIVVSLSDVSVASVDASLDLDRKGDLRLARAFEPAPSPASEPAGAGKSVHLSIPKAKVGHAVLRGRLTPELEADAEVDGLETAVHVEPGHVTVDVLRLPIVARGHPGNATMRGTLLGRLEVPAPNGTDLAAGGSWQGTVGDVAGSVDSPV